MFHAILHSLSLLLPALIPSWRFFKTVQPSPRVEWGITSASQAVENWQEYRPRPAQLNVLQMVRRMFWNAAWNESLYLVSLSERLMATESDHSLIELTARIRGDVTAQVAAPPKGAFWQFRLIFVDRDGDQVTGHITYQSDLIRLHPHEF